MEAGGVRKPSFSPVFHFFLYKFFAIMYDVFPKVSGGR